MLDTDICIDLIRGKSVRVLNRMREAIPEEVAISSITLAELQYSAAKSSRPQHHAQILIRFCAPFAILDFDSLAAEQYGEIRSKLERNGVGIGPLDTLIAAHAASLNLILITNNEAEFRRVPGLTVENWMKP